MTYKEWLAIVIIAAESGVILWARYEIASIKLGAYVDLVDIEDRHKREIHHRDMEIEQLRARLPVHGERGRFARKDENRAAS